jgi:hypothetical protein
MRWSSPTGQTHSLRTRRFQDWVEETERSRSAVSSSVNLGRTLVVNAAFFLFFLELALSVVGHGGRIRFAGLQPQDLALALLLGFEWFNSPVFRERLLSLPSLVFGSLLVLSTTVGVVHGNDFGWIRTDLRFFAWIYGGYAFFHAFWRLKRPVAQLIIFQLALAVLLFLAARQAASIHFSETNFQSGEDRLYGLNLFAVGTAQLFFLALHYTLFAPRRFSQLLVAGFFTLLFAYFVLYLSATRNLLLSYGAMLAATIPAFLYSYSRESGTFSRKIHLQRVILGVALASVAIGIVVIKANDLLVLRRFEGGNLMKDASARGRVVELQRALHDMNPQDLVTGSGIGTTFRPYYLYEANFLHLGIAGVVLKLGLPIGGLVVLLLYGLAPGALAWAFFFPHSLGPRTRSAIYCAVPILFPWLVQLGISGGFNPTHALGCGLALGVFADISRNGMDPGDNSESPLSDGPATEVLDDDANRSEFVNTTTNQRFQLI